MSITAKIRFQRFAKTLIFVQITIILTKMANFSVASRIFQLKRTLLQLEPALANGRIYFQ